MNIQIIAVRPKHIIVFPISWQNFHGAVGQKLFLFTYTDGERGGSVVECRTPEREVRGSRPTAAVLCPWARHFTPRKYWLITQEVMAPSRYDWKIVDWDVKPQNNQPTNNLHWQWKFNLKLRNFAQILTNTVWGTHRRETGSHNFFLGQDSLLVKRWNDNHSPGIGLIIPKDFP